MPYETVRLPSPHSLPRFIRICDSKLSELMLPPYSPSWQSGDAKIQFRILKVASVKPRAPTAGCFKEQPKTAPRLVVQALDPRVFDSQKIRPLGGEESGKRNHGGVGRGCGVGRGLGVALGVAVEVGVGVTVTIGVGVTVTV